MTETYDFKDVLKQLATLGIARGLHTRKEEHLLWDLARRKGSGIIVEVGSFEGYSTIILAKALTEYVCVYAIDPHTGKLCESDEMESPSVSDSWTRFKKNIQDVGVSQVVQPLRMESEQAVAKWDKPIRLLWIDGSHRYEDVKKDFLLWQSYLIPCGVVVFHDCWIAGVRRVIVNHVLDNSLFGNFKFTRCCMFSATYLSQKRRQVLQRNIWRLLFWLRGGIENKQALRKWLLRLLRGLG